MSAEKATPTPSAKADADLALTLNDVSIHFGGVRAVDGVSTRFERGYIHGILGPNGSGKSTLLAAITGLVRLTGGSIGFSGATLRRSPHGRARLGLSRTFQTVRLLPALSVLANVQLGAEMPGSAKGHGIARVVASREQRTFVLEILERMGLSDVRDALPTELPYGTQRRVEIARALASRPRLLLLDEPTAGMNREERSQIGSLLKELRDEGMTQVLVEHDVQMMVDTCDRLCAMNRGRLIVEGAPEEVVKNDEVKEAYMGKRWVERATR